MDKINFQNGVTKVNADTFNTFQNNIENAIDDISSITVVDNLTSTSTTEALSANQGKILNDKIINANTYSTSEINTGMKWIDDKDIYRKVLIATKVLSTDLNINVGNNIDTMLVISAKLDGAGHYILPFYESEQVYCRLELDGNNIKVKSGSSGYAQGTVTLIVEYTKTV